MESSIKVVQYVHEMPESGLFFLAGDIGGTNSNFGVFQISDAAHPQLLISLHAKSQHVANYGELAAYIKDYCFVKYHIVFYQVCIGVAGVVAHDRATAQPTNIAVTLDASVFASAFGVKNVVFINDFEAVAMGIEYMDAQQLVVINKGTERFHANKAFVGAGTGLGKAALLWDAQRKRYMPLASEGGHADCAMYTQEEFELLDFITQERARLCPVSWEDVLSGAGIKRIYRFLGTRSVYSETDITREIAAADFNPDKISRYAQQDARCKDTFGMYAKLYARCVKNFALDTFSLNGMYIAGGIAAKNISLFKDPRFMQEFTRCGVHSALLQSMPLYVLADYNVSLYGAYGYMRIFG